MGLGIVLVIAGGAFAAFEVLGAPAKKKAPAPSKGGGGVNVPPQAKNGDQSDPRLDPSMPAPLRAATLSLLDSPTATAEQLLAGASAAEGAGFPIAAASLRAKALTAPHAAPPPLPVPSPMPVPSGSPGDDFDQGGGNIPGTGVPSTGDPDTDQAIQDGFDAVRQAGQTLGGIDLSPATPDTGIGDDFTSGDSGDSGGGVELPDFMF